MQLSRLPSVVVVTLAILSLDSAGAFIGPAAVVTQHNPHRIKALTFVSATSSDSDGDTSETVARRIIVKGSVQGGYYRACVLNEVHTLHIVSACLALHSGIVYECSADVIGRVLIFTDISSISYD